jgi:probable rRNA maturation factor
MPIAISSTARSFPKLPYARIAADILGSRYHLSLVFIGARRASALNRTCRGKSYVPNVLSFPLDETHGEIFITPVCAAREARGRGMTARAYVGFLFIHGCLHLKGHTHGATMERAEARYCARYNIR